MLAESAEEASVRDRVLAGALLLLGGVLTLGEVFRDRPAPIFVLVGFLGLVFGGLLIVDEGASDDE